MGRQLTIFETGHEKEKPKSLYTEPEVAQTYIGLLPGTPEWMRFWKKYPEKQEEMIEYMKNEKGEKDEYSNRPFGKTSD